MLKSVSAVFWRLDSLASGITRSVAVKVICCASSPTKELPESLFCTFELLLYLARAKGYFGLLIGRFDQKRKMTKKSSAFGFLFVLFLFICSKSFVKATCLTRCLRATYKEVNPRTVMICPLTVLFNPPTAMEFPSMGVEFPLTVLTFPADRILIRGRVFLSANRRDF